MSLAGFTGTFNPVLYSANSSLIAGQAVSFLFKVTATAAVTFVWASSVSMLGVATPTADVLDIGENLYQVTTFDAGRTYFINKVVNPIYRDDEASDLGLVEASLHIGNAGIPADAVRASLSANPAGAENRIVYTAVAYGAVGNAITIAYVNPGVNNAELSVAVVGTAITVSLATGSGGAITSTAALVKAAVEANTDAAALVTLAYAADGGIGDGSGVVTALAAAPLTGGAGTGIGAVLKGGLCSDTTNGLVYRNSGTVAAPAWTAV